MVLRRDAVILQNDVHESLEGGLDPRIGGIKKKYRHLGVIGRRQATASREAAIAELGHLSRPIIVIADAGTDSLQFLQHLPVADPVPEPIHLEIQRDIGVE